MTLSNNLKKNIHLSLRILLSAMFLLSAVAKLYPSPYFALTTFEIKQLLPLGFNEEVAAYFSRTLIGCELALGILLLQPHYFKRLVLPMSFLILFIFSAHLSYEIMATGNSGNCGCFGALLPMTPVQALIKNIIAMGIIGYLYKVTNKENDRMNFSLILSVTLASILAIYLIGPMRHSQTVLEDNTEEIIDDSAISTDVESSDTLSVDGQLTTVIDDTSKTVLVKKPEEPKKKKSGYKSYFADIDKGRHVLCFFAPGCDHCKETAKELTQMKKLDPNFPAIKIIFMDEEAELIPDFFAFAGAKYPFKIADISAFWQLLGSTKDTPGVVYLWNGNLIKEYDGINEKKFKKDEFKTIVGKTWEELK